MKHYVSGFDRSQVIFTSFDELINKDSIVRLIDIVVEAFAKDNELIVFTKGSKDFGRRAYNPKDMLKLFVYGYMERIPSSRRLVKECRRNFELMWLMKGIQPEFRSICYYREQNGKAIKALFKYFVKKMFELGIARDNIVALDGIRVKGNVSQSTLNKEGLADLDKKLQNDTAAYLKELESNDLDLSRKNRLHRKIKNLTAKRIRIKRAIEHIDTSESNYVHPTDPDAVLTHSHKANINGYNVQAVSDFYSHMVIHLNTTNVTNDAHQLLPTMENMKEDGIEPKILTADKGYNTSGEILKAEKDYSTEIIIPNIEVNSSKNIGFIYDKEKDIYVCPQGKIMEFWYIKKRENGLQCKLYKTTECVSCSEAEKCCKNPESGRTISLKVENEAIQDYQMRMNTHFCKSIMRHRKTIIENIFGTIRVRMGYIPLLLRGLEKVATEMYLFFLGYNLTRLRKLVNISDIIEKFSILVQLCVFCLRVWQYFAYFEFQKQKLANNKFSFAI